MPYSIFDVSFRVLSAAILLFTSFTSLAVWVPNHVQAGDVQAAMANGRCTSPTPYTATGYDATAIQADVEAFRNAIGALNAPHPINHLDGRRQINWDAAPDGVSAPNPFAGDFFNANVFPRARGIGFTTMGTGFQLSATEASGAGVEFDNIDATYSSQFTTFSAERLFTPIGSNVVDVHFFSPGDQTTPALVDSFGVIFTDVDLADVTKMEFYDMADTLLYTLNVPALSGSQTLSLAGVKFSQACLYRVRITTGNTWLATGINETGENGYDIVAMDDFIYGEPQPITSCGLPTIYEGAGETPTAIDSNVEAFRTALGDFNAPAPFNNLDGRRQINWDAAPDGVSAPNPFAGDFFNADFAPRARGIAFSTAGTGFQLSATDASGAGIEFDNIDNSYSADFQPFSAERLFTPIGNNTVEARFFNPASQSTAALVDGFGAVFTDVDMEGVTSISYYDADGNLLYKLGAQAMAGDEGLSFAGAKFASNCVSQIVLTNGTTALDAGVLDDPDNNVDLVVMDDFIYGEPTVETACGVPNIFTNSGADAAAITSDVDAYRAALGDLNPFEPSNFDDGRRQINWDAAPDGVSAPNPFAGDFFNADVAPRARGIEFTTDGTEFQLSATAASGAGIEFDNVNPTYSTEFAAFSAERLFAPIGSNVTDARFFDPAHQSTPALTDGFGAIFTDVDLSHITGIRFYDKDDTLVYKLAVPSFTSDQANTQNSLSFAGLKFETSCISRVRITNGNSALAAGTNDDPANNVDLVAIDDLIYGEPQATESQTTNTFIYLPFVARP